MRRSIFQIREKMIRASGVTRDLPDRTTAILPRFLTAISRIDNFILGKELVSENRGIDRILRRLKLHAEGRQFGGQNS